MATFASIATRSNGDEILAGWFNDLKAAGETVETNAGTIIYSTATSYTILNDDGYGIILVSDTSSDRTITLPAVSANSGRVLKIKNQSTDGGNVIVDGASSETIDGALTINLRGEGDALVLHCDGAEWHILGKYDASKSILSSATGYTVLDNDGYKNIFITDTSSTRTVTLPTAADNKGRKLTIKNTSSDGGLVTIDGEGSESIDGELTLDLPDQYDAATLLCNGMAWSILDKIILSEVGSGAGGTGVNNLSGNNTNFNTSLGDWADFDEGAVATPVDLTGGSANQLTMALNTSTPLDGDGSMRITHAAADCQGEGKSVAVTARVADKGMAQTVEFEYLTSTPYADDDLEVWIYDVTNSKLIQPVPYKVPATGGLPNKFKAQFQNASDSTSYRVGLFCPNTTATAYTFDLDNVRIGPSNRSYGVAGSDAKAYTPTLNSSTSVSSNTAFWWRVGDRMYVSGTVSFNGVGAAADLSVDLPSGYTVDTSKITVTGERTIVGVANWLDISSSDYNEVSVLYKDTNTVVFSIDQGVGLLKSNSMGNGDDVSYYFSIPISGWSSTVVQSDSEDGRVCAARYTGADSANIAANTWTYLDFTTKDYDTHSMVSGNGSGHSTTSGQALLVTIPLSGYYKFSMFTYVAGNAGWDGAGDYLQAGLLINGTDAANIVLHAPAVNAYYPPVVGSITLYLNAGDTVEPRLLLSGITTPKPISTADTESFFAVEKLSGPSAIQASELVAARYKTDAGQSIANADTPIIDFEDITFDSHGSVTTGASWKFTANCSGTFSVKAYITYGAHINNVLHQLFLYKGGVIYSVLDEKTVKDVDTDSGDLVLQGSDIIQLNAGDYIDIRTSHGHGSALTLAANSFKNYVCIKREGF